jgi:hypothetical protein
MNNATQANLDEAAVALVEAFYQSGCFRLPDLRQRTEAGRGYKKGYEIRLAVPTKNRLQALRRWLKALGFKPAKPFLKRAHWVQPVYGKEAVVQFCRLLQAQDAEIFEANIALVTQHPELAAHFNQAS